MRSNPTKSRGLLPRLPRVWSLLLIFVFAPTPAAEPRVFTLAVIPDTQNYIDFRHQTAECFEFDAADLFIAQMRHVAANAVGNGGDIAFVASLGDVWQHQTKRIDEDHRRRGIDIETDPILAKRAVRTEQVLDFELPLAARGYRLLAEAGLPFGVAPGTHDYDATWSVRGYPPNRQKSWSEMTKTVEDFGILHVAGLDNFRAVFGDDSEFFREQPWYVASYKGGANSAQTFAAGGYRFLHLALETHPGDDVLRWADLVMRRFAGLPTIVTTHDYLDTRGERLPNPLVDLARVEPDGHNSPQQLWDKFISRQDQIFLVLSGHQHGQSHRVDANLQGDPVYQVLADYQDRGRVAIDAGRARRVGLGDGWMRLMRFDFGASPARIEIRTYSTHYRKYSSEMAQYADWYRASEQPEMTDAKFHAADEFVIRLDRFRERFGEPRS